MKIFSNHILIFLIAFLSFSAVQGDVVVVDPIDDEASEYFGMQHLEATVELKMRHQFDFDPDANSIPVPCYSHCAIWPETVIVTPLCDALSSQRLYLLFSCLIYYH